MTALVEFEDVHVQFGTQAVLRGISFEIPRGQTLVVIGRFIEAANQHIPFLLRKAERVEEYLQQR